MKARHMLPQDHLRCSYFWQFHPREFQGKNYRWYCNHGCSSWFDVESEDYPYLVSFHLRLIIWELLGRDIRHFLFQFLTAFSHLWIWVYGSTDVQVQLICFCRKSWVHLFSKLAVLRQQRTNGLYWGSNWYPERLGTFISWEFGIKILIKMISSYTITTRTWHKLSS